MKLIAAVLFGLSWSTMTYGHITLNPNFGGPSGNYFATTVKIPHGTSSKETTRIEVEIPHGVLTAVPEHKPGWDITIEERNIQPYISHGTTVTTGPSKVTWTATCDNGGDQNAPCSNDDHGGLHDDHLLEMGLQLKLGCDFLRDLNGVTTTDATVWQNQHTIWFKTRQYVSTPGTNDGNDVSSPDVLSWTATASGQESWSANQDMTVTPAIRPCPFLFIYSTSSCSQGDTSGGDAELGMRWDGSVVAPAENMDEVNTKAEVLAIIDEAQLSVEENLEALVSESTIQSENAEEDAELALTVSIVGLLLGGIAFGVMITLFTWRVAHPRAFSEALLPRHARTMDSSSKSTIEFA